MTRLIFAILAFVLLVFNIGLWMWIQKTFATGVQGVGLISAMGLLILFGTGCVNLGCLVLAFTGIEKSSPREYGMSNGPTEWRETMAEKYAFGENTNWHSPQSAPKRRRKKSGWKRAFDILEDIVEEVLD